MRHPKWSRWRSTMTIGLLRRDVLFTLMNIVVHVKRSKIITPNQMFRVSRGSMEWQCHSILPWLKE